MTVNQPGRQQVHPRSSGIQHPRLWPWMDPKPTTPWRHTDLCQQIAILTPLEASSCGWWTRDIKGMGPVLPECFISSGNCCSSPLSIVPTLYSSLRAKASSTSLNCIMLDSTPCKRLFVSLYRLNMSARYAVLIQNESFVLPVWGYEFAGTLQFVVAVP